MVVTEEADVEVGLNEKLKDLIGDDKFGARRNDVETERSPILAVRQQACLQCA